MDYIAILTGLFIGSLLTWLFLRLRSQALTASLSAKLEILTEQQQSANAELTEKEKNLRTLSSELAALKTQKNDLSNNREALKAQFQSMAGEILHTTSKRFTEQNQQNIESVLNPLKESMTDFKKRIENTHTEQTRSRGELMNELKNLRNLNQQLSADANKLVSALKGETKTQGTWGEMILDTILQRSGLTKGIEYETEDSYTDVETGKRKRPDVILRLPENDGCLIIDSKVSLTAYEKFCNTENEDERLSFLKEHTASLKTHITALSKKEYQNIPDIQSPDFIFMFIPLESAFTSAVQYDLDLYEFAFDKNIILITPSTLLATLRLVKNIWNQDRQNKHTQEIADRGGKLYDKFVDFYTSVEEIGRHLNQTQNAYEQACKRLRNGRGNLISQTETLRKLGVKASKKLPEKVLDDLKQDLPKEKESPSSFHLES
ncbi:MAG: DNA recombination protein RmuC [Verrucomicrobiota bacterium]